jgi:hypothetical protein
MLMTERWNGYPHLKFVLRNVQALIFGKMLLKLIDSGSCARQEDRRSVVLVVPTCDRGIRSILIRKFVAKPVFETKRACIPSTVTGQSSFGIVT